MKLATESVLFTFGNALFFNTEVSRVAKKSAM